jgi:hypothetical protein
MAVLGAVVLVILWAMFGPSAETKEPRGEQPRDRKGRFSEFEE